MEQIEVTVQSCGGNKSKYRLGISTKNSHLFKHRKVIVKFKIDDKTFITKTTCGQWYFNEKGDLIFTKGFDLYSKEISDYIIKMNYNLYDFRKPQKKLIHILNDNIDLN